MKNTPTHIALQQWQIVEIEQAVEEAVAGEFAADDEVRAVFNELIAR